MHTIPRRRLRFAAIVLTAAVAASLALAAPARSLDPGDSPVATPAPTAHTRQAFDPEADVTARWTRADARQLQAMSDPDAPAGESSMPVEYTMPTVPQDFPDMSDGQVWAWDSWTLTDGQARQPRFKGWEVVFSLVADRALPFDERHTAARLGYFFRRAAVDERPVDGGWTYGGHVFPDGASGAVYDDQSFSHQTEWSGSTRLLDGNKLRVFYTAVAFYRNDDGSHRKPYDPRIVQSEGRIFADDEGVWLTGFRDQHEILTPDGEYYQTAEQNEYVNFRDPFTFEDPAHPGKTFLVFEGNSAFPRGERACTADDMGYAAGDPHAETADEVMDRGAHFQMANVGLAVAENAALTRWRLLPPILSANCVNDQTERPKISIVDGRYYLFTITHRHTYAAGLDGPEGVYAFVGNGIRSDFEPVNRGSGLALGNPTNLNVAMGAPFAPAVGQHPNEFQAYSHYVMPDGLVQSFIDAIGSPGDVVRGGTLAPTVRIAIDDDRVTVDRTYGVDGLGAFADFPSTHAHPVAADPDPRPRP